MNIVKNLGKMSEDAKLPVTELLEQMEPKVKKGKAWTFHHLNNACDIPDTERVQAVLYADDRQKGSPCMPVRARRCMP